MGSWKNEVFNTYPHHSIAVPMPPIRQALFSAVWKCPSYSLSAAEHPLPPMPGHQLRRTIHRTWKRSAGSGAGTHTAAPSSQQINDWPTWQWARLSFLKEQKVAYSVTFTLPDSSGLSIHHGAGSRRPQQNSSSLRFQHSSHKYIYNFMPTCIGQLYTSSWSIFLLFFSSLFFSNLSAMDFTYTLSIQACVYYIKRVQSVRNYFLLKIPSAPCPPSPPSALAIDSSWFPYQ